jgi:regulatory protein
MAPKKPASLKVRALQWLAQREHSRLELRGKLLRLLSAHAEPASPSQDSDSTSKGAARTTAEAAAEVDALLDWLSTHGYLSQERFVESRVHARQSRFGNLRIQRELQMHGVPLDALARQSLKESEYERAREVWRKKFGGESTEGTAEGAADAAARLRQMRFLTGRGFSPEVIRRVIRQGREDGNDVGQDTTD